MRIVSLIASATEMVDSLGLGEFQVGRSHECDFPERVKALPICTRPRFAINGSSAEIDHLVKQTLADAGSVYEVFEDLLESLQPTHILTQTQCRVCAVSFEDVQRAMADRFSAKPRVVALEPNSLEEIWKDFLRIGEACGILSQAQIRVARLQDRMADIGRRARSHPHRPRVAVIEWLEPLMAAGNWTPQLLEQIHAVNLFGEARKHSPRIEWENLRAADPDVLVITACGFDIPRTREEMYWLTQRPGWSNLRAVREGRAFIADGNQFFNRPGPRVVETLQALAEMLYPGEFQPLLKGSAWTPLA